MGSTVLSVVQGEASPITYGGPIANERWLTYLPGIVLLAIVLLLGVYLPAPFERLLREAAALLEAR
ncbi:MAG: hypothetical protein QM784_33785 [Polyangiaceae bacterium]